MPRPIPAPARLIAALALVAVALAGCSAAPGSGASSAPTAGSATATVSAAGRAATTATIPPLDPKRQAVADVVKAFIAANSGTLGGPKRPYSQAEHDRFLALMTPAGRARWVEGQVLLIISGYTMAPPKLTGSTARVAVTYKVLARESSGSEADFPGKVTVEFTLQKDASGAWKISAAPDGYVVYQ